MPSIHSSLMALTGGRSMIIETVAPSISTRNTMLPLTPSRLSKSSHVMTDQSSLRILDPTGGGTASPTKHGFHAQFGLFRRLTLRQSLSILNSQSTPTGDNSDDRICAAAQGYGV